MIPGDSIDSAHDMGLSTIVPWLWSVHLARIPVQEIRKWTYAAHACQCGIHLDNAELHNACEYLFRSVRIYLNRNTTEQ